MTGKIVKFSAVLGAFVAISSTLWAAADYTEVRPVIKKEFIVVLETQKLLSDNILLLRFQILMQKKEMNQLSLQEKLELCKIAKQLNFALDICNFN